MSQGPLRFIDLSNNNPGDIDFNAVKASGVAGVILKASEGTTFTDGTFAQRWQAAKDAGLLRGAYHFAHPDVNSPEAEAAFFLRVVGPLQPDDLLVLDIEDGSGDFGQWAIRFFNAMRAGTPAGNDLWIYSYLSFLEDHGLCIGALAQYPLWLAAYPNRMPTGPEDEKPAPPAPWTELGAWQFTDRDTTAATPGAVDESWFFRL